MSDRLRALLLLAAILIAATALFIASRCVRREADPAALRARPDLQPE